MCGKQGLRLVLQSALDVHGSPNNARKVKGVAGALLNAQSFGMRTTQLERAYRLLQRRSALLLGLYSLGVALRHLQSG